MDLELMLEIYRTKAGISKEEEERLIEEHRAKNPVVLLEKKVDSGIEGLNERTEGMQEIDFYTLDQTGRLDERTEGMQGIDDYTLQLVFDLTTRIDALEERIKTLEGAK